MRGREIQLGLVVFLMVLYILVPNVLGQQTTYTIPELHQGLPAETRLDYIYSTHRSREGITQFSWTENIYIIIQESSIPDYVREGSVPPRVPINTYWANGTQFGFSAPAPMYTGNWERCAEILQVFNESSDSIHSEVLILDTETEWGFNWSATHMDSLEYNSYVRIYSKSDGACKFFGRDFFLIGLRGTWNVTLIDIGQSGVPIFIVAGIGILIAATSVLVVRRRFMVSRLKDGMV